MVGWGQGEGRFSCVTHREIYENLPQYGTSNRMAFWTCLVKAKLFKYIVNRAWINFLYFLKIVASTYKMLRLFVPTKSPQMVEAYNQWMNGWGLQSVNEWLHFICTDFLPVWAAASLPQHLLYFLPYLYTVYLGAKTCLPCLNYSWNMLCIK